LRQSGRPENLLTRNGQPVRTLSLLCSCLTFGTLWSVGIAALGQSQMPPYQDPRVQPYEPPPHTTTLSAPATPYSSWTQGAAPAVGTAVAPAPAPTPSTMAATEPTPQPMENCEVIAKIDGQIVQACEIAWQVNQIVEDNRDKFPPNEEENIRRILMQRQLVGVLDTKILYADFLRNVPNENLEAIFTKLEEPFEEIQIPQLMERFEAQNRAELEQKLHALGSSIRDMRNMFREQALAQEWLRSKVEYRQEITHEEMLNYYHTHLNEYEYPTQVRWEELMVRRTHFASRNEAIQAICGMGNEAYQNAVAQQRRGPIFGEIAKARSHGYTADQGGIHDWTTQGALKAAEINQALFSHAVGQLSDLIETESGFHIIRVLERKDAGRTPFAEVQTEITEAIKRERFAEARTEFLAKMRQSARIWTVYTGDTSYEMLATPGGTTLQR
jgi:parvulin-like peptidyl-prolyl isomerase